MNTRLSVIDPEIHSGEIVFARTRVIMVLQVFNNRIKAVGPLVTNILTALKQFEPK